MTLQKGDRVMIQNNGDIGYIEDTDELKEYDYIDVRLLTPKNELSCCVTCVPVECVIKVSDNVVPMPKSDEWFAKAFEFINGVERALLEEGF